MHLQFPNRVVVAALLAFATTSPAIAGVILVNPGDVNTKPGHPAKRWTELERLNVTKALEDWILKIPSFNNHLGTWTVRWENSRLFRNWGIDNNYAGKLGIAIDPGDWRKLGNMEFPGPGDPKVSELFPEREIYFNTDFLTEFYFDATPFDNSDDPGRIQKYDFLTVARHELGHAAGIEHFGSGNTVPGPGVMSTPLDRGVRRQINNNDLRLAAFYKVPEPCISALLVVATLTFALYRSRTRM